MKFKSKGLKRKTWKYFTAISIVVLFMMWIFQLFFINTLYTRMKISEVEKIGESLVEKFNENIGDFKNSVNRYSLDGSFFIQVVDKEGNILYPTSFYDFFSPLKINPEIVDKLFGDVPKEPQKYIMSVGEKNDRGRENKVLFYVSYLADGDIAGEQYLFIVAPIDTMGFSMNILKDQFVMIMVMTLVLSTIMSFFMSEKLVEPILRLERTAGELAKGNYDVVFPHSQVTEIDELANTLNYATTELSKMDEMRKSIVANISHDLKTPLTVIKSYAEMIKDITGDDKESRDRDLQTIIDEANALTEMVNQVLDVSKLEMEMGSLEIAPLDLLALTNKVIDRLKVLQLDNDFEFIVETRGDTVIAADSKKIEQVIYNFFTNAMNYTGNEKDIKVVIEGDGENVIYSVVDSGQGIPQEEIEEIWTRYYTKNKNHVRHVVGTGLGLYIVKVILDSHNFKYGVESEVGVGSRFYFIAPSQLKLNS